MFIIFMNHQLAPGHGLGGTAPQKIFAKLGAKSGPKQVRNNQNPLIERSPRGALIQYSKQFLLNNTASG